MAYKAPIDFDFLKDIQSRREYVSLKLTRELLNKPAITSFENEQLGPGEYFKDYNESDEIDESLRKNISELMVKTSNQLFVGNLMNPNTKVKRLLLNWSTGIGKTIGALIVAVSMIRMFERTQAAIGIAPENMPNVFIIGHTRERVIDDLLKFPEFGFCSPLELEEQKRLNKLALSGDPVAISRAKDHFVMLKRRITNKARGGYFRFFGYQELVNRFFGISKDDSSTSNLIANLYDSDADIFRQNIKKAVEDKLITINEVLLNDFKNSLMVIDESHNQYNSNDMNSWGACNSYIMDNAENLRVIMMSATFATNSVGEFVNVMNLATEPHEFPRIRRGDKNINIEAEIKKRLKGRVSYLQDSDLRTYPKRVFYGESLKVNGQDLPYLKFIKCPMSKLQERGFADFEKSRKPLFGRVAKVDQELDLAAEEGQIKDKDDYYIRDIALPNPDEDGPPLYRAKEARVKISGASDEWKRKNGIDVNESKFIGDFLKAENIGKYSSKYKALITRILHLPGLEKIVLFHNFVKMSGVYMLAELLRMNGYIDHDTAEADNTICAICNKEKKTHKHKRKQKEPEQETTADLLQQDEQEMPISTLLEAEQDVAEVSLVRHRDHEFVASRFGIVHGEQPQYVNQRIFKMYNNVENLSGLHMRLLIGAQMIRESVDLKGVRHFEILSMPVNIPTLLQIIGRGIRKGSHDGLPMEDKICEIAIYITTYNNKHEPTIEELAYAKKLNDYKEIQKVEQIIHANSIDAAIHRDIIMSPDILAQYGPNLDKPKAILGSLYYTPDYDNISKHPTDITFYAYDYHTNEISVLVLLIRRLFYLQPVWTFDTLLVAIRDPPFRTEISPSFMTNDNVVVALNKLMIQMAKKESGKWAIVRYGIYYIKMPKIQEDAGALIISAPDAQIFGCGLKPNLRVEISKIINHEVNIAAGLKTLSKRLAQPNMKKSDYVDIFCETGVDVLNAIGVKLILDNARDKGLLEFFEFFNLLIKASEVPKSILNTLHVGRGQYIGYLSANGPVVYSNGQWKILSLTSPELKKVDAAAEQPPLIGYLEEVVDGRVVFKVRRTLKEIEKDVRDNHITDARLFERGAICTTKSKPELLEVVKTIRRRYGTSLPDDEEISTKNLCSFLRQQLILGDAFLTGGRFRTFYWYHEQFKKTIDAQTAE